MSGTLGTSLDGALQPGPVRAEANGASAEVEVVDVDRLGARVRSVRVNGAHPVDVVTHAGRLPEATNGVGPLVGVGPDAVSSSGRIGRGFGGSPK